MTSAPITPSTSTQPTITPPFWLLAELTYRCPLHCRLGVFPRAVARARILRSQEPSPGWRGHLRDRDPSMHMDLRYGYSPPHGNRLGWQTHILKSKTESAARLTRQSQHPKKL
jgi:hypothetical protein